MSEAATITATVFKATCLDLLDQLAARKITRLNVTKRGKIVAVLTPPEPDVTAPSAFDELFGAGKGMLTVAPDFDFTESPWDGEAIHSNAGFHMSQDYEDAVAKRPE
jgi:hypothetical protein